MTLPEVLRQVRRLEIRSRRLVRDLLAGEYSSAFKGRGVEFADVRPYLPGDDVRTLDWRVTARTGTPHVRRYTEERELTVLFVVDRSASDGFGSRRRTKAELANEVCAALALAAVRNNDRVGVVLCSDRVERFVPPAKGKRHALRVLRELVGTTPRSGGTDLAAALEFVSRVLRRRAVVFVLSDWLDRGYERALERVARRHDTVAVQLADARERELPEAGLLVLRDPERGTWRAVDTSRPAVRDALRREVAAHDAALAQALQRRGVDLIRLGTHEGYLGPLLAFFRARERRMRA
jgi:uncharacterized protein (DUF58 family)